MVRDVKNIFMKNNSPHKFLIFFVMICSFAIFSCQNIQTRSQQIHHKIENEPPTETPEQIMERAAESFAQSSNLNIKQKEKLKEIYIHVYIESKKIRTEIGQSKSLLFKTLAQKNYKQKDINEIKRQIVNLDQKRLKIMFDALDDVQKIVGTGENAENFYMHFQEYEFPRRGQPYRTDGM